MVRLLNEDSQLNPIAESSINNILIERQRDNDIENNYQIIDNTWHKLEELINIGRTDPSQRIQIEKLG